MEMKMVMMEAWMGMEVMAMEVMVVTAVREGAAAGGGGERRMYVDSLDMIPARSNCFMTNNQQPHLRAHSQFSH